MAQDVKYSDARVLSCLEQAGDAFDPQACIGMSADDCMADSTGGYSTVGMGICLNKELEFWDGFLNEEYVFARSQARKVDTQNGADKTLEHALRDMQRAWIGFRDAACDFERTQWGEGSGRGPAGVGCMMRMTGEQALFIKNAWIGQ